MAGWSRVGATVRSSVRQYMFLTMTSPAPNPQFLKYVILCWITLIASPLRGHPFEEVGTCSGVSKGVQSDREQNRSLQSQSKRRAFPLEREPGMMVLELGHRG